ncbi:conserved hypothetical protein [Chelatococcus asaccharovorans]|nr:hypothetical protein [Chelatococcus asaccharovorans]CAH1673269.1 conserved hypothetical protein [Chelatococcus asaccharovorans]
MPDRQAIAKGQALMRDGQENAIFEREMRLGEEDEPQQIGTKRHRNLHASLVTAGCKLCHNRCGGILQKTMLAEQLPDQGLYVVLSTFTLEKQRKQAVFFIGAMQGGIGLQGAHDRYYIGNIDLARLDRTNHAIEDRALAMMLHQQKIDRVVAMIETTAR